MKHHPDLEEKRSFRRVLGVVTITHAVLAGIPLAWVSLGAGDQIRPATAAQIQWIEPQLLPAAPATSAPESDELVARVISRTPVVERQAAEAVPDFETRSEPDLSPVARPDSPTQPSVKAAKPRSSAPVRLYNRKNRVTQSAFIPEHAPATIHGVRPPIPARMEPGTETAIISAGEDAGAEPSTAEQDAISAYHTRIQQVIEQHWSQPKEVLPGVPAAKLAVTISKAGKISNYHLAESSGNAAVDRTAMNAVESISSIDPLPSVIRSDSYQLLIKFVLH